MVKRHLDYVALDTGRRFGRRMAGEDMGRERKWVILKTKRPAPHRAFLFQSLSQPTPSRPFGREGDAEIWGLRHLSSPIRKSQATPPASCPADTTQLPSPALSRFADRL